MLSERKSGILLHPTSLPGSWGIGEIGPEACRFADTLHEMGQHLWQILPMGPTSYGDSPYQALSTFAGNHLLISFDLLVQDGLLSESRLARFPKFDPSKIDYGPVIIERMKVLQTVCRSFERCATDRMKREFQQFCRRQARWLDDYALYMAIKDSQNGKPWIKWPRALAGRKPEAMNEAVKKFKTSIRNVKILQFIFHDQWRRLKTYCHRKNIKIIGDIPIFVAHDSADVWAHPDLYYLDGRGNLTVQAGVPPDYFSATGQLWGNPLYRWDVHAQSNYAWWAARLQHIFQMVDVVRIDHFRGFEAYWEVAGDAETAISGQWVKGPNHGLFDSLLQQLGPLPIIAEDLGVITPEVEKLRDDFGFPGMRILQFAFGNDPQAENFRPHNFPASCVVYTGTHDNDTTVGWFHSKPDESSTRTQQDIDEERRRILDYVHTDGSQIHWDMISLAAHSRANTAVVPLQDVLGLDSSARMNRPGIAGGNWGWRFHWEQLTPAIIRRMRDITASGKR